MSNADATHFDDYREQTRVKHQILEAYLPAYFTALSGSHQRFAYIDGFAGRGAYKTGERDEPGSPIRALQLLKDNPKLSPAVEMLFIEDRADFFAELEDRVSRFCDSAPPLPRPRVVAGAFREHVADFLRTLRGQDNRALPPTFMFVDPCGLAGVDFETIVQVLIEPRCEVFIFFNLSGLRRVVGADQNRVEQSSTLASFFGGRDAVDRLYGRLLGVTAPIARDMACLDAYRHELTQRTGPSTCCHFASKRRIGNRLATT